MNANSSGSGRPWVDSDDAPELTDEFFEQAEVATAGTVTRPAAATMKRTGRPKSASPKVALNLRLDPDVVEHFRATGPGWQSRINETLRKVAGL
ncbi:BrnA antitoxin family protein [Niveispirillum irakense]|uniref:BrnA antitoxin family protein n=1 Tax=Niveispirillum irakense TaxID=34011 RepID=UPI000428314A|nr:BrnA antitoxin family protein [Niveispirillum irakense]